MLSILAAPFQNRTTSSGIANNRDALNDKPLMLALECHGFPVVSLSSKKRIHYTYVGISLFDGTRHLLHMFTMAFV